MVRESYQTPPPATLAKVVTVLAPKAMRTPKATGTSMPMRAWRKSRSALAKNGWQQNSTTGSARIQEAHCSKALMSGVISPGPAT